MDNSYKSIITSEHRDKPKYMATVDALLKKLQDAFDAGETLITAYEIDNAQGRQLDWIGAKVGAGRTVNLNNVEAYNLGDVDYKLYIKAKIAMNNWTGGIEDLQELWKNLFGSRLIVKDNQDMSMDVYLIGTLSETFVNLIKANCIIPKPLSVKLNYYYMAPGKVFSYGLENDLCTGYGGWWRSDDVNKVTSFAYDKIKTQAEPKLGGYDVGYWNTEV